MFANDTVRFLENDNGDCIIQVRDVDLHRNAKKMAKMMNVSVEKAGIYFIAACHKQAVEQYNSTNITFTIIDTKKA